MRNLLWIELDGFYAAHHPGEGPGVVARDRLVLDANPTARERGVKPGLPLRQAKALIEGLVVHEWRSETYEVAQTAWLDLCTEFSGRIEPAEQHTAGVDLDGHPDPIDIAERLIRSIFTRTQRPPRYGLAPSKWIAQLAAQKAMSGLVGSDPAAFLAPFPVEDLLPVAPEHRERLRFLGYRTVGEVARLPLDTLYGQFGQEALRIQQAANGHLYEPVHPLYPRHAIRESFLFESPIDDRTILERAIGDIARRVGERLTSEGRQGSHLRLQLETEAGPSWQNKRRFTKPIRCGLTATTALRLLFPPDWDRPLLAIRVELAELERTSQRQESLQGFLPQGARRPDADAALKYVRTVYGDQAVKRGSDIELPRRLQVLREWKNATGWR